MRSELFLEATYFFGLAAPVSVFALSVPGLDPASDLALSGLFFRPKIPATPLATLEAAPVILPPMPLLFSWTVSSEADWSLLDPFSAFVPELPADFPLDPVPDTAFWVLFALDGLEVMLPELALALFVMVDVLAVCA